MLKPIKIVVYVFIAIVALTAVLVLGALAYLWFFPSMAARPDLPYLGTLVTSLILEVVAVVIALAKKGFKYLPSVVNHRVESQTLNFLRDFVSGGSTVQIVSSRLTWMKNSPELLEAVRAKAANGTLVEVITPSEVIPEIKTTLAEAGVRFFVTAEEAPPEARFTLINGNRSGAERLAIARGSHPDHEVTVFDNNSGPQIIGMAKDIIRKAKALANARRMG